MSNVVVNQLTISSGGSLSGALALPNGECPFMLVMPSGWDAAGLTFQVTIDGTNYVNLYDVTGEFSISSSAVGSSRAIGFNGAEPFLGALGIKVRSGTSGSPVNQTADRKIHVITRKMG